MIKDYNWVLFPIIVIAVIINKFIFMPYGIDSLYDEGFLYLSLLKAQAGAVDGSTQWAVITNTLLGSGLTISELRYIGYGVGLLSVLIFIGSVSYFLHKCYAHLTWKQYVVIDSFIAGIAMLSMPGLIVHYNEWQRLWYMFMLSGILFYLASNKEWWKNIALAVSGFFSVFAIFTIPPGGVLIFVSVGLLVILHDYYDILRLFRHVLSMIGGMLLALVVFHLCFENLIVIWEQMKSTAETVTTLNRGYDPLSFLIKILLFCRDAFFCIAMLIGFCWCATQIKKHYPNLHWLAVLFLFIAVGLYAYYQEKPNVTTAMLFSLVFVGPIFEYLEHNTFKWDTKKLFDYAFLVFLFVFPVMASIGTNVYLGGKMTYFLMPWGLLAVLIANRKMNLGTYNVCMYVCMYVCMLLFVLSQAVKRDTSNVCKFEKSEAIADRYITQEQYDYFDKVYDIVHQYGFEEGESVMYSTQLDAMTVVVLGADFCGPYFQPMDFNASWQNEKKVPDFIFLCEYDKAVSGKTLHNMGWGFPEDFDEYYVGAPETAQTGYPTDRWLYCRKQF